MMLVNNEGMCVPPGQLGSSIDCGLQHYCCNLELLSSVTKTSPSYVDGNDEQVDTCVVVMLDDDGDLT